MAHGLSAVTEPQVSDIDWTAPWLKPWRQVGQPLATLTHAATSASSDIAGDGPTLALTNAQALNTASTNPVRFVPASDLPAGTAYESYIFDSNYCPTREGLHDFFNGLAWLLFPLTKRRINHLHVEQIANTGIQPVRGPARDGLTVFDENAAFFQGPDALWDALAAKNWRQLFLGLRPLWKEAQIVLFGHALLEKLVCPRKPITAHVYRVHVASNSIADMDTWIAADLSAQKLARKPFAHLPVLGVPHWWPANEDPSFYADESVFRPTRQSPIEFGSIGAAGACN